MTSIQKTSTLSAKNLHDATYVEDLLAEGERVGAITPQDTYRVQYDLLELLRLRLQETYGTRTGSVPDEVAEELFESILYTVSLALRASPDPDASLCLLLQAPTEMLYQKGLRICRILLRDVRVLTTQLVQNETPAFNPFYSSAIRRELPAFLRRYAPDIRAHEHGLLHTYATEQAKNTHTGVEYVRTFATQLLAETYFCNLFDRTSLARVLSSPRARGENVFGVVLTHACIGVLSRGVITLDTTDEDARDVRTRFDASAAEKELSLAFAQFPFVLPCLHRVARQITE